MEILITGGTGFIGSVLAERCFQLGHRVTILGQANTDWEARRARDLQTKDIVVILGSVLDEKLLASVCDGKDAVIHLAAAQHESDVDDSYFTIQMSAVRGTCSKRASRRVLEDTSTGVR